MQSMLAQLLQKMKPQAEFVHLSTTPNFSQNAHVPIIQIPMSNRWIVTGLGFLP